MGDDGVDAGEGKGRAEGIGFAVDAPRLIRKILVAAPELLELNAIEAQALYGVKPGAAVRLTPVFDSPLAIAA